MVSDVSDELADQLLRMGVHEILDAGRERSGVVPVGDLEDPDGVLGRQTLFDRLLAHELQLVERVLVSHSEHIRGVG